MRFSPYGLTDYALHHGVGGAILPADINPDDEATWNLCWASIPQYDAFLDLKPEDFESFRKLLDTFPHDIKQRCTALLINAPGLASAFAQGTPAEAAMAIGAHRQIAASIFGNKFSQWIRDVMTRLDLAHSLHTCKEAAEICDNVLRVDFKARKRL